MPTRASRGGKRADFAQNALRVVEEATGEALKRPEPRKTGQRRKKNPHAVALSRLGASKGGLARKAKLTPEQRAAIALKAARTRWAKKRG